MERLAETVSVGVLIAVGVGYAVVPNAVSELLAPGMALLVDGIRWANESLPRPVFIAVLFLLTSIVAILLALSVGQVIYQLLKRAGPRTRVVYRKVTPQTPIGKVAFGFGVIVLFLLATVWVIPTLIGELSETPVGEAADLSDDAPADRGMQVLVNDTLAAPSGAGSDAEAYDRPTPDTDGDRLQDSWERAGETPNGAALPDADPQRLDLYVQVNYGGGTYPLTEAEKSELRQAFAGMAIENPDGSEGITLHLDDDPPRGGPIGTQVSVSGRDPGQLHQYYDAQTLGARACRYQQVVFGSVARPGADGVASTPGYVAVVNGQRYEFEGAVSPRVQLIVHQLLHTVVGEVDGDPHTDEGWLAPRIESGEKRLTPAVSTKIETEGLSGSGYYQQNVCGG